MVDYVEDQLCGVDGVEDNQDNSLLAADNFRTGESAENPYRKSTDHKRREIEEGYRAGVERPDCGAQAEDEEYKNILNTHAPTTLPKASPGCRFTAATTDVTRSGTDPPNPTIVSPINPSESPA